MFRFRNILPLALAVLSGIAILGAPASARADFNIYLQEDGGAITLVGSGADFTAASFTGTFGDFKVSIFGATSDNGASLSDLLSSTTSVENLSGSTHTLSLYASQTNYTLPTTTKLNVESGLGGSISTGTVGLTGIFQAYADANNNLLGFGDFTNGPQNANLNGSTFDTGSATGVFNRDAGPYSLTSVANLTLSGHGKVNYSDHINVTAVPVPAGLVLVLSAMPVLGIGTWLRRRKAVEA